MKLKMNLAFYVALFFTLAVILTQTPQIDASSATGTSSACKELNHVNCYQGQNEGNFCSSKDKTTAVTRWYFEKNKCKKFTYKGCNGNRNRFCSREACERRCGDRI